MISKGTTMCPLPNFDFEEAALRCPIELLLLNSEKKRGKIKITNFLKYVHVPTPVKKYFNEDQNERFCFEFNGVTPRVPQISEESLNL